MAITSATVSSLNLNQPSRLGVQKTAARGLPPLPSRNSHHCASGGKKLKVDQPFGIGGDMKLRNEVDALGRKPTRKGVYQFVDEYMVLMWMDIVQFTKKKIGPPTGDVYVGGKTGLAIWAVTFAGILAGGALLVYNTSALSQ